MATVANKRKHYRSSCLVPVDGKKDDVFSGVRTIDFSKRGLGFLSRKAIPVGKTISIELDLSEYEPPVIVIGKIMWCRHDEAEKQFRVGVEFIDILRGSKSRLDQYFKKQSVKRWV
jgi:c-di-GMP-binding flagellar brake protein YcgR